jgi:hypothetical protein
MRFNHLDKLFEQKVVHERRLTIFYYFSQSDRVELWQKNSTFVPEADVRACVRVNKRRRGDPQREWTYSR